jgi:hypothetical protein
MLLLPSLDNRTFDQLFAEGRGLIPGIAPGWTDQNYSDPGVTVIELLAWLSETILYRLDRTPDEMRRAFLRLVGFEPRPALVAETVLLLSSTAGSAPVDLPGGLQLADAGALTTFQTAGPVVVSPAAMIAVLTGPEAAPADVTAANSRSDRRPQPATRSISPSTRRWVRKARRSPCISGPATRRAMQRRGPGCATKSRRGEPTETAGAVAMRRSATGGSIQGSSRSGSIRRLPTAGLPWTSPRTPRAPSR